MNEKYNYAIIGCGAAGKVHAFHFLNDSRVESIAATDTDYSQVKYHQKHFGFKRLYTDYNDMLDNEKIDILSIASPPVFHAEQVIAAAKKGVHILCEKPLAISVNDAIKISQFCKERNVLLGIMLPRRYYNCSASTKKVLDNNLLGKITLVNFRLDCNKERSYYNGWRGDKRLTGGGVLMSQAIHSIDQLVFFFGEPASVEGKVHRRRDYIEVEDEAVGRIRFKNGIVANLIATANSKQHEWKGITEIKGEKGKIVLDSEKVVLWDVPDVTPPRIEESENIPMTFKPSYYGPGHLKVINNFLDAVKDQTFLQSSAEMSIDALKIVHGIYHSSESGKEIFL